MRLEYLIKEKREIKEEPIIVEKINDGCRMETKGPIVSFITDKNNHDTAKELSDLDNKYRSDHPNAIVLLNEASAYYNKILYPLINDFERLLRKFVYLRSYLNELDMELDSNKTSKNTDDYPPSNLEEKDFGKLYVLLFTEKKTIDDIKKIINGGPLSKGDIIKKIETVEEDSLWKKIIINDNMLYIQEHFQELKEFRNDVMHCHLIDFNRYTIIKNMYQKANKILREAMVDDKEIVIKLPVAVYDSIRKRIKEMENTSVNSTNDSAKEIVDAVLLAYGNVFLNNNLDDNEK